MADKKENATKGFEKTAVAAFSKAVARQRPRLDVIFKRAAANKGAANEALLSFNKATQRLLREEARHKTRDRWQKLSLTHYLRTPDHVEALKDFRSAKESLLAISPVAAQKLIFSAEEAILKAVGQIPAQRQKQKSFAY